MQVVRTLGWAMWLSAVALTGAQAAELVGLAPYSAQSWGQQADAATGAGVQTFVAPSGAVLEAIRWWGFHGVNSQGPGFDNLVVTLGGVMQSGELSIVQVSPLFDEYTLKVADATLQASSLEIVNNSLDVEWFWQSAGAIGGGPDAQNLAFSLLGRVSTNVPEPSSVALLLAALLPMCGLRCARNRTSRRSG